MRRELSDESVAHQAEQLLAYAAKHGCALDQVAGDWARSKDLGASDFRAVLRAARLAQSDEMIR